MFKIFLIAMDKYIYFAAVEWYSIMAERVLRGGSWNNNAGNVRSACRNRNEPDNRNDNIGFRFARGP